MKKLAILLPVLFSALCMAQTADEIVAKAINARGGMDKLKAVQSQRLTGKIQIGPDTEGILIVEMKRPGKIREELDLGGKQVVRTSDGSSGWGINPFAGETEARQLPADEMENMAQKADFDRPLVDYKAKGHKVELLGKEKVEDKDAYKLKITLKDGNVRYDYIDASSFQEIKWQGRIVVNGQEVEATSYFRDYRPVEGVYYPFVIDSQTEGNPGMQKIVFDKIEINPSIEEARFGKPTVAPSAAPAPQ